MSRGVEGTDMPVRTPSQRRSLADPARSSPSSPFGLDTTQERSEPSALLDRAMAGKASVGARGTGLGFLAALALGLASVAVVADGDLDVPDSAGSVPTIPGGTDSSEQGSPSSSSPAHFTGRGRLVCVAEELARKWRADVPVVHDHILGFLVDARAARTDVDPNAQAQLAGLWILLRTSQSEALFVDPRFRAADLILTGRRFPEASVVEVSGVAWIRDEIIYAPYYWCDVCSIRTVDPSICACCQREVELREERLSEAPRER
jgi:hypothetical protein